MVEDPDQERTGTSRSLWFVFTTGTGEEFLQQWTGTSPKHRPGHLESRTTAGSEADGEDSQGKMGCPDKEAGNTGAPEQLRGTETKHMKLNMKFRNTKPVK